MMNINFFILNAKNAINDTFLKIFGESLSKVKKPSIVLHEPIRGNFEDTWFYTKRISAKLTENLVVNLPFYAGQKGLFTLDAGRLSCNSPKIFEHLKTCNALVINNFIENQFISLDEFIGSLKSQFIHNKIIVFPQNYLSTLAADKPILLSDIESVDYQQNLYPEENNILTFCKQILPVHIANPQTFGKFF